MNISQTVNGKAAFAFVKFDNTDSPAKAVSQEVRVNLKPMFPMVECLAA